MPQFWQPAPQAISLEPGWAHIYHFALDPPLTSPDCLSADERQRAARFYFEIHRQRFISAHIQLRQVLAAYLNCDPAGLLFSSNAYGKPALTGEQTIQFNLSHSQDQALLAVCAVQAVGVDIEYLRENVDRQGIARRFFSPTESAALAALPEPLQPAAFVACWTRKEAYIKARGRGLSIPLDSFDVSILPGAPVSLTDRSDDGDRSQWTIVEIPIQDGWAAALAVEGQLTGCRLWQWPARA